MHTIGKTKTEEIKSNVLAFERGWEFYYKRGVDHLDSGRLPDALKNLRTAMHLNPESADLRLTAAQALHEAGRYDESNRLIIRTMEKGIRTPECYYGLGCNFAELNDLAHARDSLEMYIASDPYGEYVYDAYDILDAIDDADYELQNSGESGLVALSKKDIAFNAAEDGRVLLEQERYTDAEASLKRALKLDPDLYFASNNLALVYYCQRKYKKAADLAGDVLSKVPDNIQALCNLSISMLALGNASAANESANRLLKTATDDPEDLNRISLVLIDLSRYDDAYSIMLKLKKYYAYDENVLHRFAICCLHAGRYAEAIESYDTLLKIDPHCSIARYYRGLSRSMQLGAIPHSAAYKKLVLNFQVPYDEMLSRIKRLNEMISRPKNELDILWANDTELYDLILWGLSVPDRGSKYAILVLISSFVGENSESLLRDFILHADQPDDLKHAVFAMLNVRGAKEPYLAYLDGNLVESHVSDNTAAMKKQHKNIVLICLSSMQGKYPEKVLGTAVVIWDKFINSDACRSRLSKQQTVALAAALEYLACRECDVKAVKSDICAQYGVSALRFKNALSRLEKHI